MRDQRLFKAVVVCAVVVVAAQAWAQPTGQRRRGLYGDWVIKSEFNGRTMESILSFSRDQDGNQTGQWISFWGVSDLKNVQFEDGQVSFTREMRGRDGETMTSTFKGTIADSKLTGTVSGGRGDYTLEGQRAPRSPRVAGIWDMTLRMEDREFPVTLTIGTDEEGELTAKWASERGELNVTDIEYNRGTVTMNVKSDNPERQWEATFEGQLQQDGLTGTIKSERGEITAEGKRRGGEMIGTWNLELTGERGTRQQRLVIRPDLTALYGAMPVKDVKIEGDQVNFKITMSFGDRDFEMDFAGKVQDGKLNGELTTSMGSQKVTGTKVVRTFRRRNP